MKTRTSVTITVMVVAALFLLPGCDSSGGGSGGLEAGAGNEPGQCQSIAGHWSGHMISFEDPPKNYTLELVIREAYTQLSGTVTLVQGTTTLNGTFIGGCTNSYWEIYIDLGADSTDDYYLIGYQQDGTTHGNWQALKTGVTGTFDADKK